MTWRTGDWGSFHGSLDWSELSTGKQLRLERRDGQRQGPPHLSTSACIVSALEPRQEASGRVGGNHSLSTSEQGRKKMQKSRRFDKAEAESRVDKWGLPSGIDLESFLCLWRECPGDTQSELGSPSVWRGLPNILIYFPKLFGWRKPPSPCAKPFPPLFVKPICSSREIRFMCFQFIYT